MDCLLMVLPCLWLLLSLPRAACEDAVTASTALQPCSPALLSQAVLGAAEHEGCFCSGKWALETIETQTEFAVLEEAVSVLGGNCPEKSGISRQLWDLFLS